MDEWATEDKWVLQGQPSDSLEGTKHPLQKQDTTRMYRHIHDGSAASLLVCHVCAGRTRAEAVYGNRHV